MLNRFAAAFPGPILDVTTADVDTWLRGLEVSLSTPQLDAALREAAVLLRPAQNYLPEERPTATAD